MFVLKDLLKAERIELDRTVTDWREGIRAAGVLLEKTNSIDSAYTDAMIASVEEKGPYIVVAPGFAFAHARPPLFPSVTVRMIPSISSLLSLPKMPPHIPKRWRHWLKL